MQDRINILYVIDGLNGGGKERQLIEILKNIDKSRFKIGLVTFNDHQHYTKQAAQLTDYFRIINKHPYRSKPLLYIWHSYREFNPDIVHTWDSLSSFYTYLPSKYFHTKIIDGSIRDSGVDKGWEYHFKRFFLKRASLIVSNSKAGLKAYRVKGEVVYNVIDRFRFLPSKKSTEFNIVMTANFSDFKDQQTFLNAAVILIKDKIADNIFLIGEGPQKDRFINWIGQEYPELVKQFHFTGAINNVEEYLAFCHVGVLCSTPEYSEGLSNAVLEYMAGGLVPIVTDLGGSAEIIENGQNGYLIKPKDFQKIVDLVYEIYNDFELRIRLISCAKKTIEDKFSLQHNIRKLTSVYESLFPNN
jgi:glycosyltransferase involved in cell wall biosynthesis